MPDIKEQLDLLNKIQKLDVEIYRFELEKERMPKLAEECKANFGSEQAKLAEMQNNLKSIQVKRKEKEIELETKEQTVKKYQTQLYQIKSNKEYSALQQEIEGLKTDASVIEDDIIKILEDVDRMNKDAKEQQKKIDESKKALDVKLNEIALKTKEIDSELARLREERNKIQPGVDKEIYEMYDKIMKNRDGIGIVSVENEICGGCYLNVPPQIINEIKMYMEIKRCERCGCILYIPEVDG